MHVINTFPGKLYNDNLCATVGGPYIYESILRGPWLENIENPCPRVHQMSHKYLGSIVYQILKFAWPVPRRSRADRTGREGVHGYQWEPVLLQHGSERQPQGLLLLRLLPRNTSHRPEVQHGLRGPAM